MKKRYLLIALVALLLLTCSALLLVSCDEGGEETPAPVSDPCATGHSFGGEQIVKNPTCTKEGSAKRVCSVCEKEEEITLAATGHKSSDMILDEEATCFSTGSKHKECTICQAVLTTETIPQIAHTFGDWRVSKAATCSAQGSETRVCTVCEASETRSTDKLAHTEGESRVTREATHQKAGVISTYCSVCNQVMKTKPITKIANHAWTEWKPVAGSDIYCGNTVTYTRACTVKDCGLEESEDMYVEHVYGEPEVIRALDCENDGIFEYTCTRAGCDSSYRETVTTTGHAYSWIVISEQTCTTDGVREQKCATCQAVVKRETLQKLGHQASDWLLVSAQTCTEDGLRHKVCTREGCGAEIQTETLPALGHVNVGWEILIPATCTENGLRRAKSACSRCLQKGFEEEIVATGHTPGSVWITVREPVCGVDGWEAKKCTTCQQASDEGRLIEAPDHEFGAWTDVTPATCTTNGARERVCTNCSAPETETLLALGHDFSGWEAASDASRVKCGRDGCDKTYAKEEYAREIGEKKNVTLTGYSLVYSASNASDAFKEKIEQLGKLLRQRTGMPVTAYASTSAAPNASKVINVVIGSDGITGHGFLIQRQNSGAILIRGTTALIAQMGVDYFMNTYLTGSTISLSEKAISDAYQTITLSSSYTPIYSASADTVAQEKENSSNYDVYYGVSSETGRDYVVDVALTLASALGTTARADSTAEKATEILIGKTSREQTAKAQALLKGHEYGIMVIDGKLVLAGWGLPSLHMAGKMGESYLSDALYNGSIVLPKNLRMIGEASERWLTDEAILPTNLPLYNTADDAEGAFQYLYRGNGVNKAAFDAYVAKLKGMGYVAISENSAEGSYFVTLTDANRTQMLNISYEAYAHASDNTAGTQWKNAWGSDPAIRVVTAYVQEQYTTKSADLPTPGSSAANKGIKSYESGITEVYYLYKTKPSVLAAYRDKFVNVGYTVIFSDNAGERYVLVNNTTGEWAEIFYSTRSITTSDVTYTHSICRRHYAPGVITLPSAEILNPNQSYKKVTDTKIVSIDLSAINTTYKDANGEEQTLSGSYGTGYVIMLEDGSFVIIDGGSADGGTSGNVAWAQVNNFWSILKALYKDVYGKEPTPSNPVHIAAWIITHAPGDHMNVLWDGTNRYGGGNGGSNLGAYWTIDYLIANNPEYTMQYNTGEPNMTLTKELTKINGYVANGFTYLKAQTGQKYYFANLEIDTLFTHGNLAPQRIVTFNDVSTIQRLSFVRTADTYNVSRTINHTSYAASAKTTFLSTGDMYAWGGRWLAAMYGSYMKTDMVSVSHHGGPGATAEFYDVVAPKVVWWSMAKGSAHGGYSTNTNWYSKVDQHLIYNVTSVDYIYIADDYHITLTLKEAGPNYSGIYHATDENKTTLSYYTVSKSSLKTSSTTKRNMRNAQPVAIKKT